MSDAPLTDCPECGKGTFSKMVTAAGFQLKGSGWYVTDFKNGSKPKKAQDKPDSPKKEDSKESKAEATSSTGACPASN